MDIIAFAQLRWWLVPNLYEVNSSFSWYSVMTGEDHIFFPFLSWKDLILLHDRKCTDDCEKWSDSINLILGLWNIAALHRTASSKNR